MEYAPLGNTGVFVSRLSLGALTFGSSGAGDMYDKIAGLDQEAVTGLVERALAAGVNLIDTANVYSDGQSERMVGQALRDLAVDRSSVLVATKFFGRCGSGPNDIGGSRKHIVDSVDRSLSRLGLDFIDLYQMHGQENVAAEEEYLRALDDLVAAGKVRYVGCSNWQAWKLMKALGVSAWRGWARFQSVQGYYSIAGRDIEREVVPLLEDQDVSLLVWGGLAWGLLSGKYARDGTSPTAGRLSQVDYPPVDRQRAWTCIDRMRVIGEEHGVSVARVALAWILSKPFVTSLIVGAKSLDQLEDNLAALELELTGAELAELDQVSALPTEYPGWAVNLMGRTRWPEPDGAVPDLGDRLRGAADAP
ncbi:MAG TPA: aldo/keto reductase [Acidimicrobiales bacterium]|nr:aldo/keto reductase [Acidimicrobiales bacterium]